MLVKAEEDAAVWARSVQVGSQSKRGQVNDIADIATRKKALTEQTVKAMT